MSCFQDFVFLIGAVSSFVRMSLLKICDLWISNHIGCHCFTSSLVLIQTWWQIQQNNSYPLPVWSRAAAHLNHSLDLDIGTYALSLTALASFHLQCSFKDESRFHKSNESCSLLQSCTSFFPFCCNAHLKTVMDSKGKTALSFMHLSWFVVTLSLLSNKSRSQKAQKKSSQESSKRIVTIKRKEDRHNEARKESSQSNVTRIVTTKLEKDRRNQT